MMDFISLNKNFLTKVRRNVELKQSNKYIGSLYILMSIMPTYKCLICLRYMLCRSTFIVNLLHSQDYISFIKVQ